MKILYIDHHAALPSSGGDCRAVQLAQGWQQCGDEVTIVTAGYSHRRGKNLTVEKEMEEQQLEGVTFCPLLSPDYDHGVGEYRKSVQSFLKKLYLNAPKLVERYHPEIVIAASGYPYDYFCAQRIAKLAHAKTVFELRETWPELQRELYPAEDSRLNQCIAEYAMGYALRGADTVVSFLQKGEDYCRQRRSPRPTWHFLCGMAQGCDLYFCEAVLALRERYPVIAAYAGHLNDRHLPELLVGAAGNLREQGIAAVIAGNGGDKQLLRRVIRENNWENILLLDAQSERRQRTLYGLADILYYGDDRRCDAPYGPYTPLLLRMMQNEKPILTVTHSPFNDAQRAGCAVPAGQVTQRGVEEALLSFTMMNGEKRVALGRQAGDALCITHAPAQVARDYRGALLRLWV